MCSAGDLDKVKGGSGQDRARDEGTAPSARARASAHKRRVFVFLGFCVVPYFSSELLDFGVVLVCASIWWYVQIGRVVNS